MTGVIVSGKTVAAAARKKLDFYSEKREALRKEAEADRQEAIRQMYIKREKESRGFFFKLFNSKEKITALLNVEQITKDVEDSADFWSEGALEKYWHSRSHAKYDFVGEQELAQKLFDIGEFANAKSSAVDLSLEDFAFLELRASDGVVQLNG